MRNRIAHHERIIGRTRDLPTECKELIETIGWLNPEMREWVESRNCFYETYTKKLKRTSPLPVPADNATEVPS